MSAAGHSSPPPTSAAVLEFICLFTHDLRRKQKRWQDGRLKYHTFNNRVMVYDDRGNFVGDMHWRHDWDLVEGEEVQLERGGVIVQVQELSSRCEQDLSELLEKRAKEKEQRQMQAVARTPNPIALPRTVVRPVVTHPIPPDHPQARHRPLHQFIGTPSAHHGRALVPKVSPFEQRQQPAESPDQPAAKRRKYDPPPSKSGYALALFGQALTLSATPTISVPIPRRRQIQESDSSQEDEVTTTRTAREEPKPQLREQPKTSRHFNQPSERPSPMETAKSTTLNQRDVEDIDEPRRRQKELGLSRKQGIERRREPTPVDPEGIDVDQINATPAKDLVRPSEAEKRVAKQPKVHGSNVNSVPTSSRYTSNIIRSTGGRVDDVPNKGMDLENTPKVQARSEKSKKPKTSVPNAIIQSTGSKSSTAKSDDLCNAALTRREATVPVTELRIKSRKKRGLMVMSDLVKKPQEQPCGDLTMSRAAPDATKTKRVEETDCPSRSPSPLSHDEPHCRKPDRKSKSKCQPTDSTKIGIPKEAVSSRSNGARKASDSGEPRQYKEHHPRASASIQSGKDGDQFLSLRPPRVQVGSKEEGDETTAVQRRRISAELGVEDESSQSSFSQPASSAGNTGYEEAKDYVDGIDSTVPTPGDDNGAVFQLDIAESSVELVDDAVNTKHTISPQGKDSDPFRLPSSSPQQLSELHAGVTSNVTARASPRADGSKPLIPKELPGARQLTQDGKRTVRVKRSARRPREQSRRSVVLDENDQVDVYSASHEDIEVDVDEPVDMDYDTDLTVSKKPRNPKQIIKKQLIDPEASDEDKIESDCDEVFPRKHAKPQQASKTTKRTVQKQQSDLGSDDEQPVKRRRTTRKIRAQAQAADFEEAPPPSEQEDSEEEASSRNSLNNKISKNSKGRPRLEKIKQSVKSRELIGFNFSAPNARLGLRGIGMPFGILSSYVNGSTPRSIDSHVAVEPLSDHLSTAVDEQIPVDNSNIHRTHVEAGENTVAASSLEARRSAHYPNMVSVPLISGGYMPGHGAEVPENSATFETLHRTKCRDSPIDPATVTGPTEAVIRDLEPRTSTTSNAVNLVPEQSEFVAQSAASDEGPSIAKVAITKPFIPTSMKPMSTKILRSTSSILEIASKEVFEQAEVEAIVEAPPAALRNLSANKAPEQKPLPAPQLHTSSTATVEMEPKSLKQAAEYAIENNPAVISTSSALTHPERRTKPTLSRQASGTADGNNEHSPQDSRNSEVAIDHAAVKGSDSGDTSVEKPPSAAFQRQTPIFKAPAKVKVDTAQNDNESNLQYDRLNIEPVETDSSRVTPITLTRVLSGSNSGLVGSAQAKPAAPGSDATESTQADRLNTSPLGKQKRVGLHRTVSATRRINNLTIEPPRPAIVDCTTSAEGSTKPVRIANPASRGRKAAVKSDAKGPIPQRLLPPTQPFAMIPVSTADFAATPIERPPEVSERPKKKMTFPGFQSARGEGPWSREAFDLLESGRPG